MVDLQTMFKIRELVINSRKQKAFYIWGRRGRVSMITIKLE
jgi:hypothetical protein